MKFDIDLGGNLLGVGDQVSGKESLGTPRAEKAERQNGNINVFEPVGDVIESAEGSTHQAGAEVALPALEYHAHDGM
jgi:hypothetical protein